MVGIRELIGRIRFWRNADRIGPDIPLTHWRLYFKTSMRELCIKKFKSFGEGSEFRPGAFAEACSKISIGSGVTIRPGTFLFADPDIGGPGIIIEDKVSIGTCVQFFSNNHKFCDKNKMIYDQGFAKSDKYKSIVVRKGSWIGSGAIILPGVEVGENAVIGAGTVVTKSVPPHVVFAGNPGRIIRTIE